MLNFPSSPINGQEYDNWVYNTAKGAWLAKPLEPMAAVPSPVAPANPQPGDMWFNTNEATTYVYYDDGNTSQWVEMVAQTGLTSPLAVTQGGTGATTVAGAQDSLKVGLVNVIPTGVAQAGGSFTLDNATGLVSFTGVTDIQLQGVFSTTYTNYRIVLQFSNTATTTIRQRLVVGSTPQSSALYYWRGNGAGTSGPFNYIGDAIDWGVIGDATGFSNQMLVEEITAPADASKATRFTAHFGGWSSNIYQATYSMVYNTNQAQDGIRFYSTAGTITGTAKVFAYN